MGNTCTSCSDARAMSWGAPIRKATLVLLGLDDAGKTTLIANLNNESTENASPTIGFSNTTLDVGRFNVTVYDLGGGARIRDIWKNYYAEAYGVIYVVDATSVGRLDECKETLSGVLEDERMAGKPLLVFANKQDKNGAIDDAELINALELNQFLGDSDENRHQSNVVKCISLKSASGNRSDPSIRRGVRWVLECIGEQYDVLTERVRVDSEAQRAVEAQQRRERAERVRKIREERERLAALEKAENGEEEEEEDLDAGNPFRPIQVVTMEAERREEAIKHSSVRIVTVAEATADESTEAPEHGRHKDVSLPAADLPLKREESGVTGKSGSRSTLASNSQPTSGLSESSDSLTDVTPPSHSATPSLDSADAATLKPNGIHRVRLEPLPAEKVKKEKKKHRKMFLSRLKNRNKTAPAPETPNDKPEVSRNAWVTPAPPTDTAALQASLEGLPELPGTHHVLPPITVARHPPGLGEQVFHVAEDITVPQSSIQVKQPLPNTEPVVA